jgi:FkbM family methyltransferase
VTVIERPRPDIAQAKALLKHIAQGTPARHPTPPAGPLVLYGAGKLGAMAAEYFERLGQPVACAIDRHPPADGLLLGRIPVKHPEAMTTEERATLPLAVCVVTQPYTPIRDALAEAGWRHVIPVYDLLDIHAEDCGLNNGWFAGALDPIEVEAIAEVLAGWHDDASRAAHLQCLAWRVLREEWIFANAPVVVENRYFIPEVRAALRADERIVDAGAWHGEVLARLLDIVGGHVDAALAIEPDPDNMRHLTQWRDQLPSATRARVRLEAIALGDHDGAAPFSAGLGLSARLRPQGAHQATLRRLDALELAPSFVKLHLEGHELAALRGATATLARHRPLVTLTTYHNRDGLWPTPQWLMRTLPDYRFLMRMHGWCGTGAVVYAIPAERWAEPPTQ